MKLERDQILAMTMHFPFAIGSRKVPLVPPQRRAFEDSEGHCTLRLATELFVAEGSFEVVFIVNRCSVFF